MKKILYIDMDGVIADFDAAILHAYPIIAEIIDNEARSEKIDEIVSMSPNFFIELVPIDGAIEAVNELFELFDVYFLSSPMWNIPESYTEKRLWIKKHFGDKAKKRLILTHRKDLCIGDFIIDDRTKNGVSEFKGTHIHFGTPMFPDWEIILNYLKLKNGTNI